MADAMDGVVTLYVTFESESDALSLARTLLKERLIACANILPPGRSVYRWDDDIVDAPETYVLFKTQSRKCREVIARIEELHSYDTPCIGVWPWADGAKAYMDWVKNETQ